MMHYTITLAIEGSGHDYNADPALDDLMQAIMGVSVRVQSVEVTRGRWHGLEEEVLRIGIHAATDHRATHAAARLAVWGGEDYAMMERQAQPLDARRYLCQATLWAEGEPLSGTLTPNGWMSYYPTTTERFTWCRAVWLVDGDGSVSSL